MDRPGGPPASASLDTSRRSGARRRALAGSGGAWALFLIFLYSLATYGNCRLPASSVQSMCPYARFQSAMFDKDTLIISYDEPRGAAGRAPARYLGPRPGARDCIDCTLCVQVCPTESISAMACNTNACLRRLHRRLRQRHGQDGLAARPDPLHHRAGGAGSANT